MTQCRYDRTTKQHLTREHRADCTDHGCTGCKPCTHDDHGNPVRHCRTRLRCTSHLDWSDHTCPTCVGKIRTNLTRILDALALMPNELEATGNLHGPASAHIATAHPESWRRRMLWNAEHGGWVEDVDEQDPWQMLGIRERMIRGYLGHDHILVSPTLTKTCGYLDWVLTDLARDPDQVPVVSDLLAETARLANHLEVILRDGKQPEKGAPCRSCPSPAPRLYLKPGHWCTRADCTRQHFDTDEGDRWVCPVDRDHQWTAADYRRWVYADARAAKTLGA